MRRNDFALGGLPDKINDRLTASEQTAETPKGALQSVAIGNLKSQCGQGCILSRQGKEALKGNQAFTRRQVVVTLSEIIVQMQMDHTCTKTLKPLWQRDLLATEEMPVTYVEAMSKMRVVKCSKQFFKTQGNIFKNIFHGQNQAKRRGLFNKRRPEFQTLLNPEILVAAVAPPVIAGMHDQPLRTEEFSGLKNLVQAGGGCLLHEGINRTGIEIHERRMNQYRKTFTTKFPPPAFGFAKGRIFIEIWCFECNFRLQPLGQKKRAFSRK